MPADPVLSLRPTDGTSAAISAAIERAKVALTDAENHVTAARRERDAALLDAEPKTLAALERRLTDARALATDTAERIGTVLAQLEARLTVAKRAEAVAAVSVAATEFEAAGRALLEWWAEHRDNLAVILRDGERLDTAVATATHRYAAIKTRALVLYPDEAFDHPANVARDAGGWQIDVARMTEPVPPVRLVPSPTEEEQALAERRALAEARYEPQAAVTSSRFATRA